MNASTLQLLLKLAVATPLAGGLILAFGNFLPKRLCKLVAFVGFLVPLLVALHLWWAYSDAPTADAPGPSDLQTRDAGPGDPGTGQPAAATAAEILGG